jgi:hypothetical protein
MVLDQNGDVNDQVFTEKIVSLVNNADQLVMAKIIRRQKERVWL